MRSAVVRFMRWRRLRMPTPGSSKWVNMNHVYGFLKSEWHDMSQSILRRLDRIEPTTQTMAFAAALEAACNGPPEQFAATLYRLCQVGPDTYDIDFDVLTQDELLLLIANEAQAAWLQSLSNDDLRRVCVGDLRFAESSASVRQDAWQGALR